MHYPSDNISSWYASLRMCHHSFDGFGQSVKEFMWSAIRRSAVHAALKEAAQGAHPIYKPMLQRLEDEAHRRV